MKVSVVIATYNRRAVLERTLPTVLGQEFPRDDYEVIVVVDGSTDGSADALRRVASPVRLRVLEQPNRGQAAARNAGLAVAAGELVLLLDDDLFCEPDLLARHVAAHAAGAPSLVFGPVLVSEQTPKTLAALWLQDITDKWLERLNRDGVSWPADAIVMANSSLPRRLLLEHGGFDPGFVRAHEDVELGLRLWQSGVQFRFCARAVTHQLFVKKAADLVRRDAPRYGSNEVALCRRHPGFRPFSQFAPFAEGPLFKRALRALGARFPLLVAFPLWLAQGLCRPASGPSIGILGARQRLQAYRAAVQCAGGWRSFLAEFGRALPVLLYHRVGPPQPGTFPSLSVAPGSFERQMRWLKRNGYHSIRSDAWLAWCLEGRPLPPKPVLITFDDAYADLARYAFPVLRELGLGATVFVPTGEVGGENSWDREGGCARIPCLDAEQIRYWAGEGIEFGAHTRSHPDLTTLSPAQVAEEVSGSARDLARLLGTEPAAFAYPFGMFDAGVVDCVGRSFPLAFTCEEGINGLGTRPHLLRRTMVRPGDLPFEFALRVRLGYNPFQRVRETLRLRTRYAGLLRLIGGG